MQSSTSQSTSWARGIATDSAQRYPGYVARGEVRASKDAISEIAGIACTFGIQAGTASHDTCQTLGETDSPYVCSARGHGETETVSAHGGTPPRTSARERDARARFAHDSAQTLAQLAFQKNPPSAYPLRQA